MSDLRSEAVFLRDGLSTFLKVMECSNFHLGHELACFISPVLSCVILKLWWSRCVLIARAKKIVHVLTIA